MRGASMAKQKLKDCPKCGSKKTACSSLVTFTDIMTGNITDRRKTFTRDDLLKFMCETAYLDFMSHIKKKLKSKRGDPLWIVAQDLGSTKELG